MENLPNNPDCTLSGTKYCRELNMHTCAACTVRTIEDKDEIRRDIELYKSLLPEGGVARLFQTRECQFCTTPVKGRRRGYAIFDMAHPEPRRVQKWLFGKRTARIGTMIPLQLAVCSKCRTRFMTMEYLPLLIPTLTAIGGLIAFSNDPLRKVLVDLSMFAPFGAWIVSVAVGALVGWLITRALAKKWSGEMITDIMKHPVVAEMSEKGWIPITAKSRTKLMFSKSRLARGLGTAEDPEFTE